ncbi:unnamed protein product [Caenorhabditis angaria]|uniref:ABC transporter domain-containing protein n=1 Tax=Caenorhabditis angaria TaxID=860376 RepID=A0A9P1IFF8_9PELO|nr:unnamed protein product [Caenorhabditis angaria]
MLWTLILKDVRIMIRSPIYSGFEILVTTAFFAFFAFFLLVNTKKDERIYQRNQISTYISDNTINSHQKSVFENSEDTRKNLDAIQNRQVANLASWHQLNIENRETLYVGISTSSDGELNNATDFTDENGKMRFDLTFVTTYNYDSKVANAISTTATNISRTTKVSYFQSEEMRNFTLILIYGAFSTFIVLVVINIIRHNIQEKSTLRTYLVSIGLPVHTYFLAQLIFNFLKCLLIFSPGMVVLTFNFKNTYTAIYLCITMVLFYLPTISFGFLISSWFKTQRPAVLACLVIWGIIVGLPFYLYDENVSKLSLYSHAIPSYFIFTINLFHVFRMLEVMATTEQNSFWSASDRIFPLYALWIGLIFNAVMMFGLAILSEKFGKNWTPWSWWKTRRALSRRLEENESENENQTTTPLLIEQDTSVRRKLESDIDICDVVKIYEETGEMAVKGLKMRAIRGQVAVLLGHNGCGKSTTFSMISGMIKPTQGTIQVAGLDVVSNLKEARQKIGLCPQYNPLIDKLTVWEHLKIVHKLKKAQSDFKTEATELLKAIELLDSKDELSKNLSGGMKRKLCMLMALIGESSVVLLDEPTAGMDSTARVDVQTMLRKCKHNRTILLTTHNMGEADKLADWVYVMSDGKIQASGSSQFLKSKFGGGWLVTVVVEEPEKYKNVLLQLCQKFEDASKIKDVRGQMIEFSIPSEDKSKVIQLLQCFENISEKNFDSEVLKDFAGKIQNIKITSIGVSLNSLEQVFINVIEQCEKNAKKFKNEEKKRETLKKVIANKSEDQKSCGIFSQFIGLSLKRLIYLRRNWMLNLLNILIPALIMCLLLTENLDSSGFLKENMKVDVNLIPENSIVIIQTDSIAGSKWIRDYFAKNSALIIREIDTKKKVEEILKEEQFFRRIFVIIRTKDGGKNVEKIHLAQFFGINKIYPENIMAAFLKVDLNFEFVGKWQYYLHPIVDDNNGEDDEKVIYLIGFVCFAIYFSSQSSFLHVEERVSKFKRQQFLTEMSPFIYWFSMYFWEFVIFIVNMSILLALFPIFQSVDVVSRLFQLLLMCCFGWISLAPMSFIISFLVDSSTKLTIFAILFGFIVPLLYVYACTMLDTPDNLRFLFPSLPFATLCLLIYIPQDILKSTDFISLFHPLTVEEQRNADIETFFDSDCIQLAISGILYTVPFFVFTSRFPLQIWYKTFHSEHLAEEKCQLTIGSCPNVQKEREEIEKEVINHENSTVVTNELVKQFGGYPAVNGLFLGVRNGECFGLLGVNGAGKTTTIEILTGEKLACSGEAMIDGVDVRKSVKVGFCPQFDAILPDLTGREVLEILARLQNYKNPSSMVEDLIDCVGMRGNTSKPIKLCSGGQKRKISMACAILSRGKLCILDEPTAGVDPKARRDLWDIVGGIRDGNCGGGVCGSAETTGTATGTTATSGTRTKSVSKEGSEQYSSFLLTSHSMEECEALCTRIGILRKGDMIALGSCQELKSTYGNTFTLTICLKLSEVSQNEKKKEIVREVKEKFAANLLTDENDDVATDLVFEIPRSKTDKWSTKMAEVKKLADEMEIKDYYLVQSSLEDVFIKMNSQSIEKKDPQNTV